LAKHAAELASPAERILELAPDFPAPHAAAEILVVSALDDFLLELGHLLGMCAAICPVASMALALDRMAASRRAHVLAVDTRAMADLRNSIGRCYARAANTVVLLFAERGEEESLHRAFKGSRVFAILPFPLDPQRTALSMSDALVSALAKNSAPPALLAAPGPK
jgi:hypothetical protein